MARLRFYFGTMGSGKSTQALQIHHNLSSSGLRGLLFTQLDRGSGVVSSRLGVTADAVQVDPGLDLLAHVRDECRRRGRIDYVVCDEAQFYEAAQAEQLAELVDRDGVDVYAFGLLTSFQGTLFPGTVRFLELADDRQEVQVEARCWCGGRATHNARLVDGVQVTSGELKVVGDTDRGDAAQARLELVGGGPDVTYELLCRRHWHDGARAEAAGADAAAPAERRAEHRR
ncbi:MAG: thymidine kinase [Acidimicrobiales bacterium]